MPDWYASNPSSTSMLKRAGNYLQLAVCIGTLVLFLQYWFREPRTILQLGPSPTTNSISPMAVSYPPPYVRNPSDAHKSTLIFLHGTSQDGPGIGESFLSFPIPSVDPADSSRIINKTLPQLFPSARFVFPTGKKRFSTALGRESHAWFDFESFDDRTHNEALQIKGLGESTVYLGTLVDAEMELLLEQVPVWSEAASGSNGEETDRKSDARKKIVVGGFSQGSATACIALLAGMLGNFGPSPIGGLIGMSGWCPYRIQILDAISRTTETASREVTDAQRFILAVHYVRDLLGLDVSNGAEKNAIQRLPIFLGHGESDLKMKIHWGREMCDLLEQMNFDVHFKSYDELEHWWNQDEMIDLVKFLEKSWDRM